MIFFVDAFGLLIRAEAVFIKVRVMPSAHRAAVATDDKNIFGAQDPGQLQRLVENTAFG